MPYKVRNSKNDDGTYALSYGKGKKKLFATMAKTSEGWSVTDGEGSGKATGTYGVATMKECKKNWGAWAEDAYGTEAGSKAKSETPPDQQSPEPPATPGPPTFKRPESKNKKTPKAGPLSHQFAADPFDPRFRTNGEFTPLGVLVEIGAWCQRHEAAIKKVEKQVYPQAPFTVLLDQVKHTLSRECPDIFSNGDSDVEAEPSQAPEPAASTAPAGPPPPPTFNRGGTAAEFLASTPDDDIPF